MKVSFLKKMHWIERTLATIVWLLVLLGVSFCQTEKDDSNEILSLFLFQQFEDNGDGTVVDKNSNMMWTKCSHGQSWDPANHCMATGTPTTYGALTVEFCEVLTGLFDDCTTADAFNPIADEGPAFRACNDLEFGGYTNWRLPTKYELQLLTTTLDYQSFTLIFPQLPSDTYFWSSNGNEGKMDGSDAYGVSFTESSFGQQSSFNKKNTSLYVHCVRER